MINLLLLLSAVTLLAFADTLLPSPSLPVYKNDLYNTYGYRRRYTPASLLLIIITVLFAGLRTSYNDTAAYVTLFNKTGASLSAYFSNADNLMLGKNPGFAVLNIVVNALSGANSQLFIMLTSVFTLFTFIWFIRKHSCDFTFSMFLLITSGTFCLSMAAVKQSLAMAAGLYAVDFAMQKKWVRFVAVILLASLIHPYILMFLVTPLLLGKPWRLQTYILLAGTVLVTVFYSYLLENVIDFTGLYGDEFIPEEYLQEGVNLFRVLVCLVPPLLSFIVRKTAFEDSTPLENLSVNFATICAAIMVIGLSGGANLVGRLACYFDIFTVIAIPWLISKMPMYLRRPLTVCGFVGYFLYFVYQYVVATPFTDSYSSTDIFSFIKSLT